MTQEEALKYPGAVKVTFNGNTEICRLIDGYYYLYHPVEHVSRMRGVFCLFDEAEKIEKASVLNIRL